MPERSAHTRKQASRIRLSVLPGDYVVVHLPADTDPIPGEWYRPATTQFGVFIRDPRTVTLIVARRKWLGMQNLFKKARLSATMRIVTMEGGRHREVVKSLAAVGRILADSGIGAAPLSSLHSDHILVPKQDLPRTIRLLRQHLAGRSRMPSRREPTPPPSYGLTN